MTPKERRAKEDILAMCERQILYATYMRDRILRELAEPDQPPADTPTAPVVSPLVLVRKEP